MTAAVDCQQFEERVVELALGGVDEPRRAELARHAAACPSCHLRLEELSWLGERLLQVAPEIEPPPGFENRVLERLAAAAEGATGTSGRVAAVASARRAGTVRTASEPSGDSARRPARRRALASGLAAALVGALVALGFVTVTDRWADEDEGAATTPTTIAVLGSDDRAAPIVRADGSVSGTAVLVAEPRPHLLVTIDAPRPRATPVLCELVGADGQAVLVGSWTFADVERGAWAVGIDPPLLEATRMDVKDDTGAVLASATFSR